MYAKLHATTATSNNRSLLQSFLCAWFFYRLAAPLGFNRNYIRVIYNSQVKTNIPLRASARNNHTSASASPFVSAKGGEVGSVVCIASRHLSTSYFSHLPIIIAWRQSHIAPAGRLLRQRAGRYRISINRFPLRLAPFSHSPIPIPSPNACTVNLSIKFDYSVTAFFFSLAKDTLPLVDRSINDPLSTMKYGISTIFRLHKTAYES